MKVQWLKYFILVVCLNSVYTQNLYATVFHIVADSSLSESTYVGCVYDTLSQSLRGISVQVLGSNIRLRTNNDGCFRFTTSLPHIRVRFSAIGFESFEFDWLDNHTKEPKIFTLKVLPVRLQTVEVQTEISPLEIMYRTIQQRERNRVNYTTATTNRYTKSLVQSTLTRPLSFRNDNAPVVNLSVIESLQNVYQISRNPFPFQHTLVQDLRFSPNTDPRIAAASLLPLQSLNLLDNDIEFFSTRCISPLSRTGLDWYSYTFITKHETPSVGYYIAFRPKQDFMPGVKGEIWIDEKNYTVQKISCTLNSNAGVPYIDSLSIDQEYREFNALDFTTQEKVVIWMPSLSRYKIKTIINIQPWIKGEFIANGLSLAQTITLNAPIPVSAERPQMPDSVLSIIWGVSTSKTLGAGNSTFVTLPPLRSSKPDKTFEASRPLPLSRLEDSLYHNTSPWKKPVLERAVTGLFAVGKVQEIDTRNPYTLRELFPLNTLFSFRPFKQDSLLLLGINILGVRTRVTKTLLGAEAVFQWHESLTLRAGGMLGEGGLGFGAASLQWNALRWHQGSMSFAGRIFSELSSMQSRRWNDPMFPAVFEYNLDYILCSPWYDFYHEQGVSLSVRYIDGPFHAVLEARQTRQKPMETITTIDGDSRPNLTANDGNFLSARASIAWNFWQSPPRQIYSENKVHCGFRINATVGGIGATEYEKIEGILHYLQPTLWTEYAQMYAEFFFSAGWSSKYAPIQERFFLQKRYLFNAYQTDFLSTDKLSFGGRQYVSIRAEHNFSDWCWRVLGLPTYKGRGIEFIAHGGIARYDNAINTNSPTDKESVLTTQGWYTEAGFGVGRIPTFLIDVLTLRFDAAWGLGMQGFGKFGWSISAHLQL